MNDITGFLNGTVPVWVLVAWAVYMAAIQALPRPDDKSPKWYVWLFAFAHGLSVNLKLAFDPKKKADTPAGG